MAALAHVRGLVNAGVPVQWCQLARTDQGIVPLATGRASPMLELARNDASLADLPQLLAATALPVAHDRVVAFTVPEFWPWLFEPGRRNVGCTAWETDRLPAHWRTLLDLADAVVVPSRQNRDVMLAAGVRAPLYVVPHVRRHAWNAFSPAELDAARREFRLERARTVFYSINAWDPRKDLGALLRAFVAAFTPDDPVALVVKTGPAGFGAPPLYRKEAVTSLAQRAIDAAADAVGHPPPAITMLPYELSGRALDLLHRLGDVYVSLSHGEAWGLGAFDAATLATPLLMTGWGGHRDYLGDDAGWPGALRYRITRVPVFPPDAPSYWRSQRWASVDDSVAVQAMRDFVADPASHRRAAEAIAERIANDYAEPRIALAFLAALDGSAQ
ncbi:MAG: glycosyltransferase [Casimicrobiaceae bacterium]